MNPLNLSKLIKKTRAGIQIDFRADDVMLTLVDKEGPDGTLQLRINRKDCTNTQIRSISYHTGEKVFIDPEDIPGRFESSSKPKFINGDWVNIHKYTVERLNRFFKDFDLSERTNT